jgi:hypothetical protein
MIKKKQEQILYRCIYVDGSGQEYDEGIWIIKTRTPIMLIVEKISENEIYGYYDKGEKIRCQKGNGNPLIDHGDGTFTIYPNQGGTPFYFEIFKRLAQEVFNFE